jgi:hypothetical protein
VPGMWERKRLHQGYSSSPIGGTIIIIMFQGVVRGNLYVKGPYWLRLE